MVKAIAVSIVVVLLVSSSAFGQILNNETWGLSLGEHPGPAENTINVSGAAGAAGAFNAIGTLDGQAAASAQDGLIAGQGFAVGIVQGGAAINGGAATIGIAQAAEVDGAPLPTSPLVTSGQFQNITPGGDGTLVQAEGVVIDVGQRITKTGGPGVAVAGQGAGNLMGQGAGNAAQGAGGGQGSAIIGVQFGGVIGGAGATGSVESNMDAIVVQVQQVG